MLIMDTPPSRSVLVRRLLDRDRQLQWLLIVTEHGHGETADVFWIERFTSEALALRFAAEVAGLSKREAG